MKHSKIFVSLMLAFLMMFALVAATVSAEGETGTITINNVQSGATYTVYEILSLDTYDPDTKAYKYKAASDQWYAFFDTDEDALELFEVVSPVTQVIKLKDGLEDPIPANLIQNFAKAALAYAKNNGISPVATEIAQDGEETVVFSGLEQGYYLVQSSIGTILSLSPATPNAEMYDKNPVTTLTKTVNDDNVNIGDTVRFTITLELKDDIEIDTENPEYADPSTIGYIKDLIVHDVMDDSFTLVEDTLDVSMKRTTSSTPDSIMNVNNRCVMKFNDDTGDECTFGIVFNNNYFKIGDIITITYDAVLNENAVIGEPGNNNKAHATYGGHATPESEVTVYTAKLIIDKYAKDDPTTKLSGATFILRNRNGNYYRAYKDEDGNQKVEWTNQQSRATRFVTDGNGTAEIVGIEAGEYNLYELEAPAGYNRIFDPIHVTITRENYNEVEPPVVAYVATKGIANAKGALLPATGGIGTTLFIVFGAIAAIVAGVILVARRRMKLIGSDI